VGFGLLLACNEERLAAKAGFAEHPHREVEIVTWVLDGELEHVDPESGTTRLTAGGIQRLSAGAGIRHEERNAAGAPLRFLQMWLHPDSFGGPPHYAYAAAPAPTPAPGLRTLVSGAPDAPPEALPLRQRDATLHLGRPAAPDDCPLPAAPYLYLHVVRGGVRLGGELLGPGDAARITGATEGTVSARTDGPAEYLVWEMHAEPSYG
jgi:hypothetical protein